jgi:hypothetical protein
MSEAKTNSLTPPEIQLLCCFCLSLSLSLSLVERVSHETAVHEFSEINIDVGTCNNDTM